VDLDEPWFVFRTRRYALVWFSGLSAGIAFTLFVVWFVSVV
jgi:hypothetical protein